MSCGQLRSQSARRGLRIVIPDVEAKVLRREPIRSRCQSVALPISMLPAMKTAGEVMGARVGATRTVEDEVEGEVAILRVVLEF